MALRQCTMCGLEATTVEDLELFASDKRTPYGKRNRCKKCHSTYNNKDYDYTKTRDYMLQREYGISLLDFNIMLEEQEGKCKICGTISPGQKGVFHVDHNHNTGEIRGLLCHACNTGLGLLQDSEEVLYKAIQYLKDTSTYYKEKE